jgi:hypothetical protein
MSRSMLNSDGGVGDNEFWAKLTFDGMFLHVTPSVESFLGFNAIDMTGFSIFQLTPENDPANGEIEKGLERARSRLPARVTHRCVSSSKPVFGSGENARTVFATFKDSPFQW